MNTDNDLGIVEQKLVNRLRLQFPIATVLAGAAYNIPVSNFKYPGASFTTPNALPWVRCSLSNEGPIDQDASGCYEVNAGKFTIGIFYPKGTGSQAALSLAKTIKSLYTAEIFDDLVVESVRVNPTPEPDNSNWYGVNVSVNYSFEGHAS